MKILSASQFREIDRLSTESHGIPPLTLMENAGAAVVDAIEERFEDIESLAVAVLCGKGNNGGDGFVTARLLIEKGCSVAVFLFAGEEEVRGSAAANLQRLKALGVTPHPVLADADWLAWSEDILDADIVVDALLGTGLTRPAQGIYETAILGLSDPGSGLPFIVSIDVPSGLAADEKRPAGPAVHADLTVTFTAMKSCLVFPPAHAFAGDVVVSDIGNPPELVDRPQYRMNLIADLDFPEARRPRGEETHKGDFGRVLIVGGSVGKGGAAAMSGQAAMRAGAGLVTVATARSVLPLVASSMLELMTEPLAETESGTIANTSIGEILRGKTVLAIGPGIGTHPETQQFVRAVLREAEIPVVIDADGLNAFVGHPGELKGSEGRPVVITPHPGEMSRLTGIDTGDVNSNRIETARNFAVANNVYVVLKGFRTVLATPDESIYINATGNPGMATGGAGDILTGIMAGILAQEHMGSLVSRIAFAVHLHGLAGDLAAEEIGEEPLIATDILGYLGGAWRRIRQ